MKVRLCNELTNLDNHGLWQDILKLFIIFALFKKCGKYQIEFGGTWLQALTRNTMFTMLGKLWKDLFIDVSEWFSVPCLLLKSV